jgi:hypothetical protein
MNTGKFQYEIFICYTLIAILVFSGGSLIAQL